MMNEGNSPIIRLEDVSYSYGTILALNGVNISLYPGEIHALVGEHGAGKSSLAMILSGSLIPRSGTVQINGELAPLPRSKTILKIGVKMVYQNILLNDNFSVAESLFYANHVVNRGIWISKRHMESATAELFEKYKININPAAGINSLNLSERTVIDIIRSLQTATTFLIIDEGLDNLNAEYHRKISGMLKERVAAGMGLMLITHKIEDIYDIADKVSIMRNGRILTTDKVRNIDEMSLLRLTYTQISSEADEAASRDFNNLLKYNEAILQFLPINLIVTNNDNKIELVNDSCKQFFGLADRYYKTPFSSMFGPRNADAYEMIMEAFASYEEHTFYRVSIVIGTKEVVVNIKTMPIHNGEKLIGNIIILEDVSEFEKLQDKLILSEKLASVGLLAAGVAHEINNPLEIIYNYLTFLSYNLCDPALLAIVNTVHEEMVAISQIVSNLVTFSDSTSAEIEEVDITDIIEETINLLKFNAKYRKIALSIKPAKQRELVRLNRNEFKQVILNLIKNSFESMPDGGEIIISVSSSRGPMGRKVRMEVHDTGTGIEEEQLKNIFLPFFSTKKGQESNLGLGLSICYSIIQRYDGTISAANNPDMGCTFTVELPGVV